MIEQKIYIYGDENKENNKFKPYTWTLSELQESIVPGSCINGYYLKNANAFIFTGSGQDEQWRKCQNYKYYGHEIYASNRGRIKVKMDKDIIICDLCEEIAPKDKITYKLFKSLHKRKHIGWLRAKIPNNTRCLGGYVYQMVADASLADKYTKGKEIHHITNDGYDNRPENLIILDSTTHRKINHNKYVDCCYWPGKYDKKLGV